MASQRRPRILALGLVIGAVSFAMANAVDHGVTRAWPAGARSAWAFALVAGTLVAVLLCAIGLGVLSDQALGRIGTASRSRGQRVLTVWHFVGIYSSLVMGSVALSLWVERHYGIDGHRTILVCLGALFMLASTGRPWWLYGTVRRVGWFAAIDNEGWMRGLLFTIGALCVVIGYLANGR